MKQPPQLALPATRLKAILVSTAWTAISQVATMGLGASMGIVLLWRLGKGAQTDAAFAAYGVYGVLLVLCVGFRMSLTPRLAEGSTHFEAFDRFVGASVTLTFASGLVLVGLGPWVAAILGDRLGPDAQETIRVSLAILWLALIAQLNGALAATLLGVRGEFGLPAFAYALGALSALICLLLLPASVGAVALPMATTLGSILMAGLMLGRIVRLGYVPRVATIWNGVVDRRTVALLLLASVSPAAWQLNYVISLGYAARLGVGSITLYTYAFAVAGVVIAVTAGAGGLVLAGQLSQTWDRQVESLGAYLMPVLRAGLLIMVPAVAVAAWIGQELILALLGASLSRSDAQSIVVTFLTLSGMMLGTLAMQVPTLAAFALSWYGRIAIILLVTCVVHLSITQVVSLADEIALLGLAMSISTCVALVLVVAVVYGSRAALPLVAIAREIGKLAAVCAVAFVPLRFVAFGLGEGLWDVLLVVAGMCLFVVLVRRWLPEQYNLASRIAHQVLSPNFRS